MPECGNAGLLLNMVLVEPVGDGGGAWHQTPFRVPDPVWEVLVERRAEFPYRFASLPLTKSSKLAPWRVDVA